MNEDIKQGRKCTDIVMIDEQEYQKIKEKEKKLEEKANRRVMEVHSSGPFKSQEESREAGCRGYGVKYHGTVKDLIAQRGYELVAKIGEGQTRQTWLVKYQKGNVSKPKAAKIPKKDFDSSSVCTMINRYKKDLDFAETKICNEIQHPYIVEMFDSFRIPDGRTINVESYEPGATDLEVLVKTTEPLKDEHQILKIFGKLLEAMSYLNIHKGVLHRDIKPSNILLMPDRLKITDLQNAAVIDEIKEELLPTRGGTQHTYPEMLNAVIAEKPAKASLRTEVYSLGTTMFFALTGRDAFNYSLQENKYHGKRIYIGGGMVSSKPGDEGKIFGGKCLKLLLSDGHEWVEEITPEKHEQTLCKALPSAPEKYQEFLYRCLTMREDRAFPSVLEAREGFGGIFYGEDSSLGRTSMDSLIASTDGYLKSKSEFPDDAFLEEALAKTNQLQGNLARLTWRSSFYDLRKSLRKLFLFPGDKKPY